ncbi:hypothetical protein [Sphingobium sp. YR768]|jgi:hypothetical protein|uniref:hypothetical protein n=1 Tax=Sphingobium sp. YR768 TaxID=1884365 RepID=UPI0008AC4731|nr:hypothetical protein [Sphingobium sp. YR768]SER04851.1 hypothetical protein SAMN05518866_104234 [Sphingobium sp. YR768]
MSEEAPVWPARRLFAVAQLVVVVTCLCVMIFCSDQQVTTLAVLAILFANAIPMIVWPAELGVFHPFGVRLVGMIFVAAVAFIFISDFIEIR